MTEEQPLRALEELLRMKPYPEPIRPSELKASGIELDEALSQASELSHLDLITLYLHRMGAPVVEDRQAALLADVALLNRLCQTFLDRKVAGRIFVDSFQTILSRIAPTAQNLHYSGTEPLEPLWVDLDCYPDLEAEKKERSATNDEDLRVIAKKALAILDQVWRELLSLGKTQADRNG